MKASEGIYTILKLLEKHTGQRRIAGLNEVAERLSADRFTNIMKALQRDGLITGLEIYFGEGVDFEEAEITVKGIEYLGENSTMIKAARIVGTFVGLGR